MKAYLRLIICLSLLGCGRPRDPVPPPEFRSDHYDPSNVSAEHGPLKRLNRKECSPNAQLPENRPVDPRSQLVAPEGIVVTGRFQSEGVCDFFTGKKSTMRFFVTYAVQEKRGDFPGSVLSFFADDDCLLDEEGKPVPRNRWPFGKGEMTFYLVRNAPAKERPDYTILSYTEKD